MKAGRKLDERLIKNIKTSIRLARSARHVPSKILQVSDIPITLTGKRVEGESSLENSLKWGTCSWLIWKSVPIRKVINGAPVSSINPATLRNPECLAEYVNLGAVMRREEGM